METEQTTAVQNNTETATENVSTESTTTSETTTTNTINSEEQKNSTDETAGANNDNVAENDTNNVEKQQGAPEKYETFTVPDGFEAPIEKFSEFAKSQNWSQEQAQSAVDFYTKEIAPQMQAQQEKLVSSWEKQSTEKYTKEEIDTAINTLGKFTTPEFKELLNNTGLGSHPEMISIFKNIADKIGDSSFVNGNSSANTAGRLYANSPDMYK